MRLLRPLRLFVPLIAVGAALVVFLVFGFLAYQVGTGGGGVGLVPGVCDAGLRTASRTVGPGGAGGATAEGLFFAKRPDFIRTGWFRWQNEAANPLLNWH